MVNEAPERNSTAVSCVMWVGKSVSQQGVISTVEGFSGGGGGAVVQGRANWLSLWT